MTETLIHAPDLPYDAEWLHVDRALSFYDDLQGYVVLVHFWTSSSVHCRQSLRSLQVLRARFASRGFVVLHVHSPRFDHEKEREAVEPLLHALGLDHPVVLDPERVMFDEWQARAWPHHCLVDATGRLRFSGGGEPDLDRLQAAVQELLDEAAAEGDEPYSELEVEEHSGLRSLQGLCAPAGLALDAEGGLWVADTGNHRLLCVDSDSGALRQVVGGSAPGCQDGDAVAARFYLPRDLCLQGDQLWVVDTGNHLLRTVDLASLEVRTKLGTGRPMADESLDAVGTAQPLHSPLGLAGDGRELFFAASAQQQLLALDADSFEVRRLAGTTRRGLMDGRAEDADLAQPGALALAERQLAFLDTESSALRCLDLDSGQVTTLVGAGLQDWGDADGIAARFQDPRGLCRHGEDWLVADTGNGKIRRVTPQGEVRTLGVAGLFRPEALCLVGARLIVADTGRHQLIAVDLERGESASLPLQGLPTAATAAGTEFAPAAEIRLAPRCSAELRWTLDLGSEEQLDTQAELVADLRNASGQCLMVETRLRPDVDEGCLVLRGLGMGEAQSGEIELRLAFVTQGGPGQVGHPRQLRLRLPVTLVEDGPARAQVVVAT